NHSPTQPFQPKSRTPCLTRPPALTSRPTAAPATTPLAAALSPPRASKRSSSVFSCRAPK
ncbi:hypothetical protein DAEQUDRAFT_809705, partial [Daedalea quercina L-15889]